MVGAGRSARDPSPAMKSAGLRDDKVDGVVSKKQTPTHVLASLRTARNDTGGWSGGVEKLPAARALQSKCIDPSLGFVRDEQIRCLRMTRW